MGRTRKQNSKNGETSLLSSFNTPLSTTEVVHLVHKTSTAKPKIIPLLHNSHKVVSVPAEANQVSILAVQGQPDTISLGSFEFLQSSPSLTLPAAKVQRPPMPLLAMPLKRVCNPCPIEEMTSKKIRGIRPKLSPKLSEKCRLCGTQAGQMQNIFEPVGVRNRLAHKIATLLPFEVNPGDGLPMRICSPCQSNLDASFSFYLTCVETDSALRSQRDAESSDSATKGQYIPLILSTRAEPTNKDFQAKSMEPGKIVVDEKLVSISKAIPPVERVAQVVEALKAGLGVDVPILEKTRTAEEALHLLDIPFNPSRTSQFFCPKCCSNLSNSFELLEHELQKFGCSLCRERFCTSKIRRRHRLAFHPRDLKCTDCGVTFASGAQLRTHLKLKLFFCECCSKGYHSKPQLQKHLATRASEKPLHSDECLACSQCDKNFSDRRSFQEHLQQHDSKLSLHSSIETSKVSHYKFSCDKCGAWFHQKLSLARHIRLNHLEESFFLCNICSREFSSRTEVSNHCLGHTHESIVMFRGKTQEKPIFSFHSPFECAVCGSCKASAVLLRRHLVKHKNQKGAVSSAKILSECSLCSKCFASESNLKTHITMAHLRKSSAVAKLTPKSYHRFQCSNCPKRFKMERDLLDHRSATHLNTLLYSCDFCQVKFSTSANKKVHTFGKRVQVGYPCAVCPLSFSNKCLRSQHQQVHEQGQQKEFKCNFCEESFSKLAQLHGHLGKRHPHQVEKSLYCDVCGKGFNAKAKFKRHYRLHFLL